MRQQLSGIETAIKYAGGTGKALADLLDVSPAAITKWRREGLPAGRAIELERISGGELRAVDLTPQRAA